MALNSRFFETARSSAGVAVPGLVVVGSAGASFSMVAVVISSFLIWTSFFFESGSGGDRPLCHVDDLRAGAEGCLLLRVSILETDVLALGVTYLDEPALLGPLVTTSLGFLIAYCTPSLFESFLIFFIFLN